MLQITARVYIKRYADSFYSAK